MSVWARCAESSRQHGDDVAHAAKKVTIGQSEANNVEKRHVSMHRSHRRMGKTPVYWAHVEEEPGREGHRSDARDFEGGIEASCFPEHLRGCGLLVVKRCRPQVANLIKLLGKLGRDPICCDRGRAPSKGWANSRLQQPGRASRRDEESLRRVRQEQTEDKGLHMYGTVIKCVATVWPVCGRTRAVTSDGQ